MQQVTQAGAQPITEWVRIPLTHEELLQRADEIAKLLTDAIRLKDEATEAAALYRGQIKAAEREMVRLKNEILERATRIRSECDVVLNHPRPGQKSIIAKATQDVVRTEPMTDAERQTALWPQ